MNNVAFRLIKLQEVGHDLLTSRGFYKQGPLASDARSLIAVSFAVNAVANAAGYYAAPWLWLVLISSLLVSLLALAECYYCSGSDRVHQFIRILSCVIICSHALLSVIIAASPDDYFRTYYRFVLGEKYDEQEINVFLPTMRLFLLCALAATAYSTYVVMHATKQLRKSVVLMLPQ